MFRKIIQYVSPAISFLIVGLAYANHTKRLDVNH